MLETFSTWPAVWQALAATTFGALAVMTMRPLLPYALAFAAGAMIVVVVEEVIPESHLGGNGDLATIGTIAMSLMGYYIVMAFFAALFTSEFGRSNLGALVALKGATFLQALALPGQVTIVGIILVTATVNLLIGSASAKWALLAPIFVPMLMQVGLSPELTQAAYRIGDSSTNIITPLMPYFPLVVVFCQRYVRGAGIGTVASMMLPYSVAFLVLWTLFLLGYCALGLPLGLQAPYSYPG